MSRIQTGLAFVACLLAASADAEPAPEKGRLLVATEIIHGDVFMETVIVLLHYDATGAAGLVINRPTEVAAEELIPDDEPMSDYAGKIYWGGPVQMDSLRAMLRTDTPPEGAQNVIDSVYLVAIDESLVDVLGDKSDLRLYLGYAGWAPGQLDSELDKGSWIVAPATEEHVFAHDPTELWKQLAPPVEHRAAVSPR